MNGRPAAARRFSFQPVIAAVRSNTFTIAVPSDGDGAHVAAGDVVGDAPALPVGDVGQRDERRRAADPVALLDRVADGVDVGVAGAAVLVDRDATRSADAEAGHRARGVVSGRTPIEPTTSSAGMAPAVGEDHRVGP